MLRSRRSTALFLSAGIALSGCSTPPRWTSPDSASCAAQARTLSPVEHLVSAAEDLSRRGQHDAAQQVCEAALACDPTPAQTARLTTLMAAGELRKAPKAQAKETVVAKAAEPAEPQAGDEALPAAPWEHDLLAADGDPAVHSTETALATSEAEPEAEHSGHPLEDILLEDEPESTPIAPAMSALAQAIPGATTSRHPAPAGARAAETKVVEDDAWQQAPSREAVAPATQPAAAAAPRSQTGTWVPLEGSPTPASAATSKASSESDWQPLAN